MSVPGPESVTSALPSSAAWESLQALPLPDVPEHVAPYVDDPLEHEVLCHVGSRGGSSRIDEVASGVFDSPLEDEQQQALRFFVLGLAHQRKLVVDADEVFLPYSRAEQQRASDQLEDQILRSQAGVRRYWAR